MIAGAMLPQNELKAIGGLGSDPEHLKE